MPLIRTYWLHTNLHTYITLHITETTQGLLRRTHGVTHALWDLVRDVPEALCSGQSTHHPHVVVGGNAVVSASVHVDAHKIHSEVEARHLCVVSGEEVLQLEFFTLFFTFPSIFLSYIYLPFFLPFILNPSFIPSSLLPPFPSTHLQSSLPSFHLPYSLPSLHSIFLPSSLLFFPASFPLSHTDLEEMVGEVLGDERVEALTGELGEASDNVVVTALSLDEMRRVEVIPQLDLTHLTIFGEQSEEKGEKNTHT